MTKFMDLMGSGVTIKTLVIGTLQGYLVRFLRGDYNDVVYASDNLETVAHYYEGAVIEITVKLDLSLKREYIGSSLKLSSDYTWGCVEPLYPKDATWYSFSKDYIKTYLVSVREIFPDLSQFCNDNDLI